MCLSGLTFTIHGDSLRAARGKLKSEPIVVLVGLRVPLVGDEAGDSRLAYRPGATPRGRYVPVGLVERFQEDIEGLGLSASSKNAE
jgi:hypothetical protein